MEREPPLSRCLADGEGERWASVAAYWLRRALSDAESGADAIPAATAAVAALRIQAGELVPDEALTVPAEPHAYMPATGTSLRICEICGLFLHEGPHEESGEER